MISKTSSNILFTDKTNILYSICLTCLVLYAVFFTNSYIFDFEYAIYPDTAPLYLAHSISDSTLFTNDLLSNHFKNSYNIMNPGFFYFCLLSIFFKIFTAPFALNVISICSCILSVVVIYKVGKHFLNRSFAYLNSGLFLLYFLSMDSFYGGQTRNFGILLLCLFLLCLVKQKYTILPLFIPLTMITYLHILPSILVVYILMVLFLPKKMLQIKKRQTIILVSMLIFCMIYIYFNNNPMFKTSINNLSEITSYKYTQGVRNLIDRYNIIDIVLYFVLNLNEHSRLYVYFTQILIFIAIIIILIRRKQVFLLPKPMWIFIFGSFLSFCFIYPFYPVIASRQLVFSIPIFMIFFCSFNIYNSGIKISPMIFLLPFTVFFVIMHPAHNDIISLRQYKPLYNYIENLPKDILIAGHPDSLGLIPLLSKRAIFSVDENEFPLLRTVYGKNNLERRKHNLLKAVYSNSLNELNSFITQYKIDYFIVDSRIYERNFVDRYKEGLAPNKFILLQLAKQFYDYKLKLDGNNIFVISSGKTRRRE